MSWFDKLFGEDNGSNDDYLNKRSQRRQKAKQQENRESLLPQNNDVYERPKGKFRFPVDGLENENQQYTEKDSDATHYEAPEKDKGQSGESLSVNQQHRRRRSIHEKRTNNRTNDFDKAENKNVDNSTNQSEHFNAKKQHNGKRMRIQTDVLRANAHNNHSKSNYQAPTYHQSEFKASEVPSAIFGTKKPRPLENGVIPPSSDDDSESKESNSNLSNLAQSNQKYNFDEKSSTQDEKDTVFYNDQYIESEVGNSKKESDEINQHEATDFSNEQSSHQKTPKNNTINIENIYASQIVEEIRKERERKLLQKRQFKKALQQKRQEQNENHEDSIQHAIDEMYAEQAKNHFGESSLDDISSDEYNQTELNTNSEQLGFEDNTEWHSNDLDNEELDSQSSSMFNYEEIDLDHISDVHTVNEEYQHVDDETYSDSNQNLGIEDVEKDDLSDAQKDTTHNVDYETQLMHSDSDEKDTNDDSQHKNVESIRTDDDTDVVDAQYREISNENNIQDGMMSSPQNSNEISKQDKDDLSLGYQNDTSEEALNNSDNRSNNEPEEHVSSISDANISSVETTKASTSESLESEHQQSENEEQLGSNTINDDLNSTDKIAMENQVVEPTSESSSESIADTEVSDKQYDNNMNKAQNVDANVNHSDTDNHAEAIHSDNSVKSKHSHNVKKGSKPFNVVMTPSDKKRIMDARKAKQQTMQSDVIKKQNINKDRTEMSQHQTYSESEVNIEGTQSVKNSSDSNYIETKNSVNTSEVPHRQDELSEANSNFEVKERDALNKRQENMQQQNQQNENIENGNLDLENNTVETPSLKPEFNEASLGGASSAVAKDSQQEEKPTIRKGPNIKLPSPDILEEPEEHEIDNSWIEEKKQELNEAFYYFNVPAEVQNVTEGPSVTRFELSVEKGVKVSRITALQDDIKMALAAKDIRIEAPIPGTSLVGIEVPNQASTKVNIRSIIDSPKFKNAESKLTVAMGYRINNEPLLMDIAKTPHALIAGATGSGKSVCINSILMSLLYKNHPEELRLLLIDPKMVELAPYNGLPHLVAPVITDVKAATQSLKWAVEEMERRYKVFAKYHVRNITAFNKKAAYEDRMPKIVIVIDELADLMMMAPQEVEQSIARIAQKARACGIHMLVATQRPSVNVITGLIKANIPTRIAFMVSSSVDSRTILDSGGAERLLGYGDMLYLGSGMNKPIRVQGTFVSDEEIDDVVDFIKQQREPEYLFEEKELLKKTEAQPQDDLFNDVCNFMLQEGHISTSLIQRHFQIGYNRAARIIDQLEQLGYVSGANGSKPRDVYITEADLNND
ncbi:DNA translocase FtsK [Staphylococcus sp. ACRSN]|uniref:DNA translocase FtsK n=1 Tax=Staphylococcus sp. ACRSN TaxID=2918214 RepID=UPI001EF1620A|nr:DNA translocase FtsK [Staphylococcus sp. ACRSN]MCG7338421.1 DNA translocase FtsK [Staphylococcus sp. ACRSN]